VAPCAPHGQPQGHGLRLVAKDTIEQKIADGTTGQEGRAFSRSSICGANSPRPAKLTGRRNSSLLEMTVRRSGSMACLASN